jgi:hypothetical protein
MKSLRKRAWGMILIGTILLCLTGTMTVVSFIRESWIFTLINLSLFLIVLYHVGVNAGIYRSQPPDV